MSEPSEDVLNVIAAAMLRNKSTVSAGGGCETCGYGGAEEVCITEDNFGDTVKDIAKSLADAGLLK